MDGKNKQLVFSIFIGSFTQCFKKKTTIFNLLVVAPWFKNTTELYDQH